ncbi:MAG: DUF2218 domain-containing protein [Sneathiellales bacterium]|nr:DUF2218 domain-containing protein [Sneathiellales bacterium]
MPHSHVIIETEHASKYLNQLCKHFAHKVEVEYDDVKAHVSFIPGPCKMLSKDGLLIVEGQSELDQGLLIIQSIIDQHIKKFAWREELSLDWKNGPVPDE